LWFDLDLMYSFYFENNKDICILKKYIKNIKNRINIRLLFCESKLKLYLLDIVKIKNKKLLLS